MLKRWINALRSNQFHQIKEAYYADSNRACALGVFLSLGLATQETIAPETISISVWNHVQQLNDKHGYSFPQIADWLEINVIKKDHKLWLKREL